MQRIPHTNPNAHTIEDAHEVPTHAQDRLDIAIAVIETALANRTTALEAASQRTQEAIVANATGAPDHPVTTTVTARNPRDLTENEEGKEKQKWTHGTWPPPSPSTTAAPTPILSLPSSAQHQHLQPALAAAAQHRQYATT